MTLSAQERNQMQDRLRDVRAELDQLLEEGLTEEDALVAERASALQEELERLEQALDPDRAERRRTQGRSLQD